jgi:hypothetical protein
MALSPRVYYLFPAYPMLFAAGSVAWERWLSGVRAQWIKPVYVTLMVLMAALIAPTVIPLLPPETYIRYAAATHLRATAHRKSLTRATAAIVRRSVWLGGDGGRSCGCIQQPAAGRPCEDGNLRPELRSGRSGWPRSSLSSGRLRE